jgi:hypothetical protein
MAWAALRLGILEVFRANVYKNATWQVDVLLAVSPRATCFIGRSWCRNLVTSKRVEATNNRARTTPATKSFTPGFSSRDAATASFVPSYRCL